MSPDDGAVGPLMKVSALKKIALIVVVLLLAGAAGGWWFFLRQPEAAPETSSDQTAQFVPIPPLTVPIIRGNSVVSEIVVGLTLEVRGPERRAELEHQMPKVLDAVTVALFDVMRYRFMAEQGYDASVIKRHVKRAIERVEGPDLVADVLIDNITPGE
jgi:flagellar basal body-associated protein FliL